VSRIVFQCIVLSSIQFNALSFHCPSSFAVHSCVSPSAHVHFDVCADVVQRFLDHTGCDGIQHIAMQTDDIATTLRQMRACKGASLGSMPPPSDQYYRCVFDPISSF
jgi:hypothetical protein